MPVLADHSDRPKLDQPRFSGHKNLIDALRRQELDAHSWERPQMQLRA